MIGGAYRKKEMKRAYEIGYGKQSMAQRREAKEHLRQFKIYRKMADKARRQNKKYISGYDDLFQGFFDDTDDLIRILEELIHWHECEVKAQMAKASRERLAILRDLINVWIGRRDESKPTA